MDKKGDISVGVFVTTALIIAGFGILLYFGYQAITTGQADKEVCHQTVVLRATSPQIGQNYVPLKCKTEKICVTTGLFAGKCTDFGSEKGITYAKVKSVEDVEKLVAQSIIDCYSMMGEGKVSIFSQYIAQTYGLGSVYPSCIMCSRIAFDKEKLGKAGIDLSTMDLVNYMRTHLLPGKDVTYYDYLAGENTAGFTSKDKFELPVFKTENGKIVQGTENVDMESLSGEALASEIERQKKDEALQEHELAILFMQISAPSHGESAWNAIKTVGGTAAGTYAAAPRVSTWLAKGIGKLCTAGGWVGPAICLGTLAIAGIYQQGNVAYNRAMTAGYCGDISVGNEARSGCSAVRTINYNVDDIKQYCGIIESIP